MLALLEDSVSELGGTYAMEDTDSMAIIATEDGGPVPCPGGPLRMADGQAALKALSRKQVKALSDRFSSLNPYDHDAVAGSILKIEDDNRDPQTGEGRQIDCLAISAKRYSLLLMGTDREPELLRTKHNNSADRWSEHGLGHLLNPTNPESSDREWTAQAWLGIIRRALGLPTTEHDFACLPAIGRISISSPVRLSPFAKLNEAKPYAEQIKPFNFMLTCHVRPFGHPIGADPGRFHLIAPYQPDPREWRKTEWIDQYTGNIYHITTVGHHGDQKTARVKTYGEVLREYEFHPESKCADPEGNPCGKQTIGLLQRRNVRIDEIKNIGKESNSLEDVESGMIHAAESVYTEYPDPRRGEWQAKIVPALKEVSLSILEQKSGVSRRTLIYARTGRRRPRRKNQELLRSIARRLGLI